MSSTVFTVYFDGRYWVGLLERQDDGELRAARHVFGAEPTDAELLEFARTGCPALSAAVDAALVAADAHPLARAGNPKRAARLAAREQKRGPSTVAQRALAGTLEQRAVQRRKQSRQERQLEAAQRRDKKRERAKERHRGKA